MDSGGFEPPGLLPRFSLGKKNHQMAGALAAELRALSEVLFRALPTEESPAVVTAEGIDGVVPESVGSVVVGVDAVPIARYALNISYLGVYHG